MIRTAFASAALAALSLIAVPATATTVLDARGDFLPSFAGPNSPDLDVTSFSVIFDSISSSFTLSASLAGAVDPATPGFYVIGANTGTGIIAPFGSLGQGNVRFNQAVVLRKDATGNVGATALAPGSVSIVDDMISALIPLSLLPSTGFAPQDYGFNIWPRTGLGNNNQISDFAPENATLSAAVPEPATWAMMIVGFGAVGSAMRLTRRRKTAACTHA